MGKYATAKCNALSTPMKASQCILSCAKYHQSAGKPKATCPSNNGQFEISHPCEEKPKCSSVASTAVTHYTYNDAAAQSYCDGWSCDTTDGTPDFKLCFVVNAKCISIAEL